MIQDGDILLCQSNGFVPSLIKWGTGSIYSHVAVGGGLDIIPKVGDAETVSPGDIARSSLIEKVK